MHANPYRSLSNLKRCTFYMVVCLWIKAYERLLYLIFFHLIRPFDKSEMKVK